MNERKICIPAYAKINLSLDVLSRRPDGYHEVCMVMQSISLHDDVLLEISEQDEPGTDRIVLTCSEPGLPTDSRNLAWKAAMLLMDEFHEERKLRIHLKKRIPAAAGLAGGSTDAAAVMSGVNRLFGYGLTREELMTRAVRIGADVPFCLMGGTALAEGIGEKLTALPPAPACYVVLAKPQIAVSTKDVYQSLDMSAQICHPDTSGQVEAIHLGDFAGMAECTGNVLEDVTVRLEPGILELIDRMTKLGAAVSRMSGSGPTVFGLFEREEDALAAAAQLEKEKNGENLQIFCTEFQTAE